MRHLRGGLPWCCGVICVWFLLGFVVDITLKGASRSKSGKGKTGVSRRVPSRVRKNEGRAKTTPTGARQPGRKPVSTLNGKGRGSSVRMAKKTVSDRRRRQPAGRDPLLVEASPITDPPNADIQNAEQLRPFFVCLQQLERGLPVPGQPPDRARVLHFGDSHVEADYWSGEIRRLLQQRFGDAGPGYVMPGKPWRFFRHAQALSATEGGWETLGTGRQPHDGILGLSTTRLISGSRAKKVSVTAVCSEVELEFVSAVGNGVAQIWVDGQDMFSISTDRSVVDNLIDIGEFPSSMGFYPSADDRNAMLIFRISGLPVMPHQIAVSPQNGAVGPLHILGMTCYSGRPGVIWDNLGLIGETLMRMTSWQADWRRVLLQESKPALVVISYGANDMGGPDFDSATYHDQCLQILEALRRDLPRAAILVTGPTDRSASGARERQKIKLTQPEVVAALRQAAAATGCAFWDARAAMGGENAIYGWVKAGNAQKDLVHLTQSGYEKLAQLLCDSLMQAYADFQVAQK